jgi:hypothetical protein
MLRRILKVAALAAACTLSSARDSHAQEHPGMNMGNMFFANAAMDQQFLINAWQGAQNLAQIIPNNVSSGQLINQMQGCNTSAIYGGLNAGWHQNQIQQFGAVDRFGRYLQGQGYYHNPVDGMTYQLPSYPGGYHQGPAGYIHYGTHPTDFNSNFWRTE